MFASRLVGLFAVSFLLAGAPARSDDKKKPDAPAAADNHATAVKKVTIQEKEIELSKALAEITKQTGNDVVDRRQGKDDVKIRLELTGVTFWQASMPWPKAADANVAVFERDMKIALTDGPFQALPTSYDGMFRIRIKRIQIAHNLEADTKQALFTMEIAWEPRFQPLFIEGQADDLYIEDDKAKPWNCPNQTAARRRPASEAPSR